MRGQIPILLSPYERSQLIAWSNSEPPGSKLARDSRIILELDDGKTIIQVAEELGISRQTVSEIRNKFLILRLDGIGASIPKPSGKRTIKEEKADEVLYVSLFEPLGYNVYWSIPELAERCEVSCSTIYRFLKEHGISLSDPNTIYRAIIEFKAPIMEIAGLFLSPSICVMAFCCEAKKDSALASGSTSVTTYPTENTTALFSKMNDQFFKPLEELKTELLYEISKVSDFNYLLILLKKLSEKTGDCKDVLLISDTSEVDTHNRIERWLEGHLQFHLDTPLEPDQWSGMLREYLSTVKEQNKRIIAFQLDHLNTRFKDWRKDPSRGLGVFVSIAPLKEALR